MRAPTAQAVDYYLSRGYSQEGQRIWLADEIPADAAPFNPKSIRVLNKQGIITDSLRSAEPIAIEFEYELQESITGLRVGIYLLSTRGEYVLTSFDTDDEALFDRYSTRKAGHYISRCIIPTDLLNEGRFVVAVNASTFRIKRYFQDEQAITFYVDGTGAPGKQWPEPRLGPVRPLLQWKIEEL